MRPVLVFRTRWSRPVSVLVWGACAFVAVAVLLAPAGRLGALPAAAAAAFVAWAVWWRPAVRVSDGGITLHGIVTDVHVPWPAVHGVESRGSLVVRAGGRRYSSWAMPSPGGTGTRLRAARRQGAAPDTSPHGGLDELPPQEDGSAQVVPVTGDADSVVQAAEARMDALRGAGHLGRPDPRVAPERTAVVPVLAGLGVLAVGLVATQLL